MKSQLELAGYTCCHKTSEARVWWLRDVADSKW